MRTITKTHTGMIVSDDELKLEYLYVGDYGKENNIKADFLGYTKRIEKVEHEEVDLTDKLVVTVSSQKGCPMNCDFCDCPKFGFYGNCTEVLQTWVLLGRAYGGEDGFGLQFSINTLDEDDRNKMFRNKSRSLKEISEIIDKLPTPTGRKYTLNFAVTSDSNLDVDLMNKYFDKEKCIVKITPIHETKEAVGQGYEIVKDFDVYEKFEKPLVKDGWDVIVFVPSEEEDKDRITCGNSLIASSKATDNR